MRFYGHQDGLAMKEDFIQTQHQNPPLTEMIEDAFRYLWRNF